MYRIYLIKRIEKYINQQELAVFVSGLLSSSKHERSICEVIVGAGKETQQYHAR